MTARADELRAMVAEATPGPWAIETVKTSCGSCHRIGPFPRPSYASKQEGWACVYDDYPPGIGSPDLLANVRLIAQAPTLALEAADLHDKLAAMTAENERLRMELAEARDGLTGIKRASAARMRGKHGDDHAYYFHTATAALSERALTEMAQLGQEWDAQPMAEYERKLAQLKEDFPNGI